MKEGWAFDIFRDEHLSRTVQVEPVTDSGPWRRNGYHHFPVCISGLKRFSTAVTIYMEGESDSYQGYKAERERIYRTQGLSCQIKMRELVRVYLQGEKGPWDVANPYREGLMYNFPLSTHLSSMTTIQQPFFRIQVCAGEFGDWHRGIEDLSCTGGNYVKSDLWNPLAKFVAPTSQEVEQSGLRTQTKQWIDEICPTARLSDDTSGIGHQDRSESGRKCELDYLQEHAVKPFTEQFARYIGSDARIGEIFRTGDVIPVTTGPTVHVGTYRYGAGRMWPPVEYVSTWTPQFLVQLRDPSISS